MTKPIPGFPHEFAGDMVRPEGEGPRQMTAVEKDLHASLSRVVEHLERLLEGAPLAERETVSGYREFDGECMELPALSLAVVRKWLGGTEFHPETQPYLTSKGLMGWKKLVDGNGLKRSIPVYVVPVRI